MALFASDAGLRLTSAEDALRVLSSGMPACIFTTGDLDDRFFDLQNGIAGDWFQKFVNYRFRVAFVLPRDHNYGERIDELAREHQNHPYVRFVETADRALDWLS